MLKFKLGEKKENREETIYPKKSYVGESFFFDGELSGEEDIVIEGQFKGKLNLPNNSLTVNKGGKVEAEIHVKKINVKGEVKGNVHATEKVYIAEEGNITGDISAPRISISDGAQFKGNVKMSEDGDKPLPLEEITPLHEQNKKQKKNNSTSPEEPPE